MKKSLYYCITGVLYFGFANAQVSPNPQKIDIDLSSRVGINTITPQATFDIKEAINGSNPIDTRLQGLSLPNFTTDQRSKFGEGQTESMKIGTLIYNTTKKCIEMYLGYYNNAHQWSCNLSGVENQTNANASVVASGFEGTYIVGADTNTSPYHYTKFTITNNSLFTISNIDFRNAVTLTNTGGNMGVVANQNTNVSLNPGQSVELKYRITGTLAQGILKADFNGVGGLTATQQTNVVKAKANIQDKILETISFDTTQGRMTTQTISIPYTNGMGNYDAVNIDVTPLLGENGQQNPMKLTIPAGSFNPINGIINAILTVGADNTGSTTYLIKKNENGLQQDYATFHITLGSTSFDIILRSKGGWRAQRTYSATNSVFYPYCGTDYTPEPYYYTGNAIGNGTSTISLQDAEARALSNAQSIFNSNGQAEANQYGECTYTPPTPTYTCVQKLSQGHFVGNLLQVLPGKVGSTAPKCSRVVNGSISTIRSWYSDTNESNPVIRNDHFVDGNCQHDVVDGTGVHAAEYELIKYEHEYIECIQN